MGFCFRKGVPGSEKPGEGGEGNGRARSWGAGFRSHRHAGLRQQLQGAGQADVRGHGQQPARIMPAMGPLEEQHRFFIPPKRCGIVSSRPLPHSHLQAPALQRKFSRPAFAQAHLEERAAHCTCVHVSPVPRRRQCRRAAAARVVYAGKDCEFVQLNPKGLCMGLGRNWCSVHRKLRSIYKVAVLL